MYNTGHGRQLENWRGTSQRFGNRGGKNAKWYTGRAQALKEGPAALKSFLKNNVFGFGNFSYKKSSAFALLFFAYLFLNYSVF